MQDSEACGSLCGGSTWTPGHGQLADRQWGQPDGPSGLFEVSHTCSGRGQTTADFKIVQ